MADLKVVDFKPRWMREIEDKDRPLLEDTGLTGSAAEGPPRIYTRIVPRDRSSGVSALSLREVLEQTQAIISYAGCDLYHGFNPDFADLRSASAEVLRLTGLTIEPFEEGSFVVPARLDADPAEVPDQDRRRSVTTQDVVNRFAEMLGSIQAREETASVSIGAIQAIEGLGRLIRREAAAIEYHPLDLRGRLATPIVVDTIFLERVGKVRAARQPTRAQLETVEGKITALDMVTGTLQLSVEGLRRRVKATFPMLFQPSLLPCLGRRVRLQGQVERRGRTPVSIQVTSVEVPDDEG